MRKHVYIPFSDMRRTIISGLEKIPDDVDLIVGIPRSGLLAGNLIALSLNVSVTDLCGFIENRKPHKGQTRKIRSEVISPRKARHVLIVDDYVHTGGTLARVKELIGTSSIQQKITYCSVYARPESLKEIDIYMKKLSSKAIFEWDIFRNVSREVICVDLDGVLCRKPTAGDLEDEKAYIHYIRSVEPHLIPSRNVGVLVTSRNERFRDETEAWLRRYNIEYNNLHMLNGADLMMHNGEPESTGFKAHIFRNYSESELFIVYEKQNAVTIARLTGKSVLCISNKKTYSSKVSGNDFPANRRTLNHFK